MMIIRGTKYRTNQPGTMQLWVMQKVKRALGLNWSDVQAYMAKAVANDDQIGDMLCDEEFLAWCWAWTLNTGRRGEPEPVSLDDMYTLTYDDIEFTNNDDNPGGNPDEGDVGEGVDVDPTQASAPTGTAAASGPADGGAKPRKSTGKTSKQRSRSASS